MLSLYSREEDIANNWFRIECTVENFPPINRTIDLASVAAMETDAFLTSAGSTINGSFVVSGDNQLITAGACTWLTSEYNL